MPVVRIDESIPLRRIPDVPYGEGDGQPLLLDIVYPQSDPTKLWPVVVWVHGGGWSAGTRQEGNDWFCPYMATHGFFAVSIEYRLSGQAVFPAQIHDVKAAIRWLRANAATYRIDPDRIGIWGDSAGAHLAALAGVTGDLTALEGTSGWAGYSSRVQAVAMCSGVSDFLRMPAHRLNDPEWAVPQLFGGTVAEKKDLMRLGSPLFHVSRTAPPFFIAHGTRDETVAYEQAEVLHAALVAAGVTAELVPLVERTHSWTAQIDPPDELWRYWELAPMTLPFFKKHLCVPLQPN